MHIRAGTEVMPSRRVRSATDGGPRARRRSTSSSSHPRWTGPIDVRSHHECSVPRLRSSAPVNFFAWRLFHPGGSSVQTINPPETTKVIYGVNELDLELAGKTVRGIWKHLEQVFNIPRDAVVTVNGTRVDDTYVLAAGDELEFTKAAGVKGLAA
jgi:hypothetical protein